MRLVAQPTLSRQLTGLYFRLYLLVRWSSVLACAAKGHDADVAILLPAD